MMPVDVGKVPAKDIQNVTDKNGLWKKGVLSGEGLKHVQCGSWKFSVVIQSWFNFSFSTVKGSLLILF